MCSVSNRQQKRAKLHHDQDGKCHYCGEQMYLISLSKAKKTGRVKKMATLDHVIPKAEGGTFIITNLVGACSECNGLRGHMPYSLFKRLCQGTWAKERVEKWKIERGFHLEMTNRIRPLRPFVYV